MRRSRLAEIFLTGLFLVATVNQVGCGVFHCVAEPAHVDVPSCHSSTQATDSTPSAPEDHERGEGACCASFPVERDGGAKDLSVHAVAVALVAELTLLPPVSPSVKPRTPQDTGPPGWRTDAAPLPLRI